MGDSPEIPRMTQTRIVISAIANRNTGEVHNVGLPYVSEWKLLGGQVTSRGKVEDNTRIMIDSLAKDMPIAAFDAATSRAFDTICYGALIPPKGRGSLDWYTGPGHSPEKVMSEPDMIDMVYAIGDAIRSGMTIIGWGTTMFDLRIAYKQCRAKDEIAFVAANHVDLQLYAAYSSGILPSLYRTAVSNKRMVRLDGAADDMQIPALWRMGGKKNVRSVVLALMSNAAMTINLYASGLQYVCSDGIKIKHVIEQGQWKRTGRYIDDFLSLVEDESNLDYRRIYRNCRWLRDHAGTRGSLSLLDERRKTKDTGKEAQKFTWLDELANNNPQGVPRDKIQASTPPNHRFPGHQRS